MYECVNDNNVLLGIGNSFQWPPAREGTPTNVTYISPHSRTSSPAPGPETPRNVATPPTVNRNVTSPTTQNNMMNNMSAAKQNMMNNGSIAETNTMNHKPTSEMNMMNNKPTSEMNIMNNRPTSEMNMMNNKPTTETNMMNNTFVAKQNMMNDTTVAGKNMMNSNNSPAPILKTSTVNNNMNNNNQQHVQFKSEGIQQQQQNIPVHRKLLLLFIKLKCHPMFPLQTKTHISHLPDIQHWYSSRHDISDS